MLVEFKAMTGNNSLESFVAHGVTLGHNLRSIYIFSGSKIKC